MVGGYAGAWVTPAFQTYFDSGSKPSKTPAVYVASRYMYALFAVTADWREK
jgi:hypothetical protein